MIRVEKTQPGSPLRVGMLSEIFDKEVIIGRGPQASFRLKDPTVSRGHARVFTESGKTYLENLGGHGSTYVNGVRLDTHERVEIERARTWIQLGRALVRVLDEPETLPVYEPIALPSRAARAATPLLVIQRTAAAPSIWCKGQRVHIFPQALRVLMRMCEQPGQTIEADVLVEAASPDVPMSFGGTNLPQLVTYVRDMFQQALEDQWVSDAELASAIKEVSGVRPDDTARRALLRALVENVRGVGYRLNLPLDAVRFDD